MRAHARCRPHSPRSSSGQQWRCGTAAPCWDRALLALIVALALQVGVNYANDYSDGIRGTDAERVGPVRLVGQGLAEPSAVKRAALLSFAVAGVAGLALVMLSGLWWLLLVGAAAIVAAWTYTGGPRPYGYAGLGEVFVFVFFGLVAVGGTAAVQVGFVSALAWVCGVAVGALSCAILVVNNLRDIPGRHGRGQAHPGGPDRRPGHPPAVRRPRRRGAGHPRSDRRPWLPGPRVVARGRGARARGRPVGDPAAARRPAGSARAGARCRPRWRRGDSCWCTASCWPPGSRSAPSPPEPTRSARFAHRVGDPRPRTGRLDNAAG